MIRRLASAAALLGLLVYSVFGSDGTAHAAAKSMHEISWDAHSLMIAAKCTLIWGGEMHLFASLWRDLQQKMKARGYSTAALCFANTLALAMTSDGKPDSPMKCVKPIDLSTVRGGAPVERVHSPPFSAVFNTGE